MPQTYVMSTPTLTNASSELAPKQRVMPYSMETEQAVLGAILINNNAYYRIGDRLRPEDFIESSHQIIYRKITELIQKGRVVTSLTLITHLNDLQIPGLALSEYLAFLTSRATAVLNAQDYAQDLHELALRRELIKLGEDIVNTAYDAPLSLRAPEQIEHAESRLYSMMEKGEYEGGFTSFQNVLAKAVEVVSAAQSRKGKLSGLATGLTDLDERIGGLNRSDLIIVAGRPGMGKTSFATSIAATIAKQYQELVTERGDKIPQSGGRVGFFSLEMSASQLAIRILSEMTEITSDQIRRGDLLDKDMKKIMDASRALEKIPFYIDQSGGLNIAQIASRARRLKRQKGLDLIVIDYLQLLFGTNTSRTENRVQEITQITTSLKALAKELDIPIIALSQLSRQVESREDKRPHLADLRESGSIEQDADIVLFIFRESYYHTMREPQPGTEEHKTWMLKAEEIERQAELIIAKNRHGSTGKIQLFFDPCLTRFDNYSFRTDQRK